MSSLLNPLASGPAGPPPSINVPRAGPVDAGDRPGTDPETDVQVALKAIKRAIAGEVDHSDKLLLEKIATECQQYLSSQQELTDKATGAGPGAKLIRKATAAAPPAPGGPLGGGY